MDESGILEEINGSHAYCLESAKAIKRQLNLITDGLEKITKRRKTKQQKVRRLKNSVSNLKSVIKELEKKDLVSDTTSIILENIIDGAPAEILNEILKNETERAFEQCEEIMCFALTLHFFSPS